MSRYKISTAWQTADTQTVPNYGDGNGTQKTTFHTIALQVADLKDVRGGHTYRDGAQRLTVDGKAVRGGLFKGELAYMHAERLYGDLRNMIARDRFDGSAKPARSATALTSALANGGK